MSAADAQRLKLWDAFGQLIANTDRHYGNVSLLWNGKRWELAPCYDMLPMRWRPDATSGALELAPFTPDEADLRSSARPVAEAFWQAAIEDEWLTLPFRRLAEHMFQRIRG